MQNEKWVHKPDSYFVCKALECCSSNKIMICFSCPYHSHEDDCADELKRDALTLLKMQCEARKPENLKTHPYDGFIGNCPSCGRIVRFAQKYCHNCTQLLNWVEVLELLCEEDNEDND